MFHEPPLHACAFCVTNTESVRWWWERQVLKSWLLMGIPQPHLMHSKCLWLYLDTKGQMSQITHALSHLPNWWQRWSHCSAKHPKWSVWRTEARWGFAVCRGGQQARDLCGLEAVWQPIRQLWKHWTCARVSTSFNESTGSIFHGNTHSLQSGAMRQSVVLTNRSREV